MAVRIQLRRDTAANWSSTNPVLNNGEPGFDTTNKILKIGDGVTAWNDLDNKFATDAQGTLADSALQPGDIGVTVQGYSADTVIDANYVATENSYTTTEKNKLAGIEAGATADQTGAEIKTLYEAEADTNAYTDAEKTKLSGIATGATANDTDANLLNRANHTGTQLASTISDFDTEVSNNSSVVVNTAKVSADGSIATHSDVDLTGIGINQVLKWDGSKFVPSVDYDDFVGVTNLSYTASETDGTIVSDTGQDATIIAGSTIYASLMLPGDKTKLDGIATGAEVNVQSDWNAVSGDAFILNKPTLGTASVQDVEYFATAAQGTLANTALQSNDIADFETTTQLNTRDTANRNRANHTGTQAISTVDGLQVALDGKEPADATILKDADIGVTVQSYSANTVIDANYVATENSYTTTEKNKLAGIEAGATANDTDANLLNRANHTGTQTAATISDFDTEVSNNTDVAANTAARHDAVTVVDSSEIDFTLTGQQITASIVAGSIDESKLDASVNASLDLADTATQPGDIANIESIIGAISPTGGLNTSITIPLSPYGVNAYAYTNQPLLGRYFPYDLIVSSVSLTLDTAPTGSAFIVDIKQNGVSVFSGLLTVADGQTGSSTYTFTNSLTLFSAGDLITFDVTQVGATTPGKYPVLTIEGIRGDVQSVVVPLLPIDINAVATTDQPLLGRNFPYDFQIDDIILTLDEAPTGSSFVVDIKLNTVSIFSTPLSVDDGEDTSTTATTAYALSTTPTTITKGDLVTFSITQIGATTPGQYPVVTMIGREV